MKRYTIVKYQPENPQTQYLVMIPIDNREAIWSPNLDEAILFRLLPNVADFLIRIARKYPDGTFSIEEI